MTTFIVRRPRYFRLILASQWSLVTRYRLARVNRNDFTTKKTNEKKKKKKTKGVEVMCSQICKLRKQTHKELFSSSFSPRRTRPGHKIWNKYTYFTSFLHGKRRCNKAKFWFFLFPHPTNRCERSERGWGEGEVTLLFSAYVSWPTPSASVTSQEPRIACAN